MSRKAITCMRREYILGGECSRQSNETAELYESLKSSGRFTFIVRLGLGTAQRLWYDTQWFWLL